ncbi:type I polyketide synthase [Streptomyces malaysiensis]|uniref:type I polyketide synthase n=1 Tax=Streptomyces malaysiensis TaxID=92644 RepID=UPI00371C57E9
MSTVADSPWQHAVHDSIAVIGFSCRLPRAATPGEFWRLLSDGEDAITSVPEDRWTPRQSGGRSGSGAEAGMEFGAFLDRVDHFDADFFGISPREAGAMDPQQRLMLELGWETLEDAGLTPARIARGRTGVFVGAINDDYATLLRRHGDSAVTHHTLTGLQRGMIANRLSYLLGTRGPSMVVDSGQSSSLVAVHTAAQSLRNGECDTALAGGVHLNLAYDGALSAARFGGLSPDGRCFAFDARANGFVQGEGGGLVLLKPLARALADGDRIHGVLRGGAVNNDGGGDTLTTPSRTAQAEVLRQAYAAAGVGPDEVQYVELHGTGTAVGDPIEAAALAEVIGTARTKDRPLLVGSAKTNVGHLEGAAGITGLIKVLLSLEAAHLPPSLNFRSPNPAIPLEEWNLRVRTGLSAWPRPDAPLIAGVSSFGVGGTNAHVVVEQAPVARPAKGAVDVPQGVGRDMGRDVGRDVAEGVAVAGARGDEVRVPLPWVVSGRSAAGVRAQAARLREFAADGQSSPADIGWSLAEHRTALEHRAVVVAGDRRGEPATGVVRGVSADRSGPVFVFPGQGSQWAGMTAELLDASPVFAESFTACADALDPYVEWSPLDVVRGRPGAPSLDRVDVVQPVLWAVMVSLARVWRSHGVEPAAVVGHSQGELAAACVAGVLSLEDAARLVALRSRLIGSELAGRGGMVSLPRPVDEAESLVAPWGERICVATVNGPASTVVAGDAAALDELMAACERDGVRARRVPVDYASHTPQVERIRTRLLELAAPIAPRPGGLPMYSTVTGALLDGASADAEYWYRNLRETVRFEQATRALADAGHTVFIEVSPHPVLIPGIEQTVERTPWNTSSARDAVAVGTLRRDEGGRERLLTALAELFVAGGAVEWSTALEGGRPVDLPTYAFRARRYWLDAPEHTGDAGGAGLTAVDHPLLAGAVAPAGGDTVLFTARLSQTTHRWLADHTVLGGVVLPGSVFLDWALYAGRAVGCPYLPELTLQEPLFLSATDAAQLQIQVGGPDAEGRRELTAHSRPESAAGDTATGWTCHMRALVAPDPVGSDGGPAGVPVSGEHGSGAAAFAELAAAWPPPGARAVDLTGHYDRLAADGFDYGPAFRGLRSAWRRDGHVFAEVALDERAEGTGSGPVDGFALHPALLDAALHAIGLGGFFDPAESAGGRIRMPFSWSGVRLHSTPGAIPGAAPGATPSATSPATVRVRLSAVGPDAIGVHLAGVDGQPLAHIEELTLRAVSVDRLQTAAEERVARPVRRERPRPRPQDTAAAQRVLNAAPMERERLLADLVREQLRAVLHHEAGADLGPDTEFLALGMDSVRGIDLRDRLITLLGLRLSATATFEHSTVDRLAGHLATLLDNRAATRASAPVAEDTAPPERAAPERSAPGTSRIRPRTPRPTPPRPRPRSSWSWRRPPRPRRRTPTTASPPSTTRRTPAAGPSRWAWRSSRPRAGSGRPSPPRTPPGTSSRR